MTPTTHQPLPTLSRPPLRVHALAIMFGLILTVLCGYTALWWLPARDLEKLPEFAARNVDKQQWAQLVAPMLDGRKFIHPDDLAVVYPAAWAGVALGLIVLFVGSVSRAKMRYCPACQGMVVVQSASFNLFKRCERCGTRCIKQPPPLAVVTAGDGQMAHR